MYLLTRGLKPKTEQDKILINKGIERIMKFKIIYDVKTVLVLIIYVFIVLGDFLSGFSYSDEVFSLFFIGIILFTALQGKLKIGDFKIIFCLIVMIAIGLISNASSMLIHNFFAVSVDVLWLLKIYSAYIGIQYLLNNEHQRYKAVAGLSTLSKLFLLVSFIGAVLHIFGVSGMGDEIRYSIRAYSFIMGNYGHYGLTVAVCYAIIAATEAKSNKLLFYFLICCFEILLTTKLMAMIVPVIYFLLMHQKRLKRIRKRYFVFLVLLILVIGGKQIHYYLLDLNHPRMRLIIYSIITALHYFPLGSGFATYGSDMAKRHYSILYTKYGFENYFGLSPSQPSCLNDNYIAMVLAQFGIFGLGLFIYILLILYKNVFGNTNFKNVRERNISAALLTSMYAAALMSGTFKGAIGMLVFMTVGMLSPIKKFRGDKLE